MSKSQRVKGAAGEREFCAKLREHGIEAERELSQTRDGGGDIITPPVLWEVKRRARMGFYPWLVQASVAAAARHLIPIVRARADNQPGVVIMYEDDFLRLLTTGKL